jgi:hypothetical protein
MPTLEMIRLRSAMPNSGLLTLRHQLPPLNPVNIPDLPVAVPADAVADSNDPTKQDPTEHDTEKGGEAR